MAEPVYLDLNVSCNVDVVDALGVKKDVTEDVPASLEVAQPNQSGIVTEYYGEAAGKRLVRTYSTNGKYIIQVGSGVKYIEAIDPEDCHRIYVESDEYVEEVPDNGSELSIQ